jgi:hypothetical protein
MPVFAAYGQEFDQTPITVTFKQDGTVEARVTFNVDAVLADAPFEELTEEDYAKLRAMPEDDRNKRLDEIREYLRVRVLLKFDGQPAETTVHFPDCEVTGGQPPPATLPGRTFLVRANVPENAKLFSFTASPIFFNIFLFIRVEGEQKGIRTVLPQGGESEPFEEFPKALQSER